MSDTARAPLGVLRRFLRLGVDRPRTIVFVLAVISLIAAGGAWQVRTDISLAQLLPDGFDRQAYLHVTREFGSDNRSFIYVRDPQLWTAEKLNALKTLHEALQQQPFVERIDSVFSSPLVRNVEGQLINEPLLAAVPQDDQAAERARLAVLADPLATRNLVSPDGQAMTLSVAIREGHAGVDVGAALEGLLEPLRPLLPTVEHIGPARIESEARLAVARDLAQRLPAFALILVLAVYAACRSKFAAAMPVVVGLLSLLWALGLMGYAGMPGSMLSIMLPVVAMLAATIQVMRMFSGTQRNLWQADPTQHATRQQAADFMVQHLGLPILLMAAVMALGFAGNALSDMPIIHNFALMAAFTVLASGVLAVLLIPALYVLWGSRERPPRPTALSERLAGAIVVALVILRRHALVWLLGLATLIAFIFAWQPAHLHVANDTLTSFRPTHPLVASAERMHADIAGVKIFYVTLDANAEGAFRDPANLQRLADIQAFIAKQGLFDRSLSLADLIAQANQEAAGGRPDAYQVPPTRKLVSQYLLLHAPRDLAPYVSHDLRQANIVVRHNVRNSTVLNQGVRELRQAVANLAGPMMVTSITGGNLQINAAAERLLKFQASAIAALLAVVFIGMALMFTSIKGGIIALVPSVVPILLMLGGMQVFEIPLSAGTMTAAIVIIGIAAEGTVHLFSRYSALCRNAIDYDQAVSESVRREAPPMIASSLALALACSAFVLSDFSVIAQFGLLAAMTLLLSTLANLLITPLVMSRIRLVGLYEMLSMSMQRDALMASPLFAGMTEYQIRKTIVLSELREYGDGEYVVRQGALDRSMYLLVSGELDVVRRSGNTELPGIHLTPGAVFGEIGFVHETRRIADVRARGPVTVLRFDHARLQRDLALFPYIMAKLNFNISGILGRRLVETVEADRVSSSQ